MLFLGTLALLQCWFLPGFVVLSFSKLFKIEDKFILSPLLSLFLNYLLVIFLVLLNQFNFTNLVLVICAEFFLIGCLYIMHFRLIFLRILNFREFNLKFNFWAPDFFIILFFILFLFLALNTIGEVIHLGDTAVMWNEWSKEIYLNKIPATGDYPLAYPILGAITYKLLGTYEIEFFARIICLIYPLWIFIIYIRLKRLIVEHKNILYFTFLISLILIFYIFRHYALFIGYVDPILFFITISLGYLYILIRDEKLSFIDFIVVVFAISTPAITKQTGILLTGFIPFILLTLMIRENKQVKLSFFFKLISLVFLFSASFYLVKFNGYIFEFDETSNVNSLIAQVKGSYSFKLIRGLNYAFGIFYPAVIILFLISLKNFYSRIIGISLVLPYFLIWSIFFGNDNRNLSIAIPMIAFVLSAGLMETINFIKKKISNKILIFFTTTIFFFSIFMFINLLNEKRNREILINKNIEKQMLRGINIGTNILIYENLKKYKNLNFYTDDYNFIYLPKTDNRIVILDPDCSKLNIQLKNSFLLFSRKVKGICNEKIPEILSLKNNSYNIIFENKDHILFKFN